MNDHPVVTTAQSEDQMKISKKILGTFAAFLTTACGVAVDQNQINRINEGDIAVNDSHQVEGFYLSGDDFTSIGDASTLTTSANSLTCGANSGTEGIESNITYDLTGKETIVKINNPSVGERFGIESSSGNNYYLEVTAAGIVKPKKNSSIIAWHRSFTNTAYLHVFHDATWDRIRVALTTDGVRDTEPYYEWVEATLPNYKVVYHCDDTGTSNITDLEIDGATKNLSLSGGGGGGGTTDSSGGGSGGGGGGSSSDMVVLGSGSNLSSTTTSLTCPANGDNSGAESASSFDFNGGEVIVDLSYTAGANNNQKLTIQGASNNVGIRIFKWGSTYQAKAFKDGVDLVHKDLTATSNELKITHLNGIVRWYANGVEYGNTLYSATAGMKIKLECGNEAGTFSDLTLDGVAQNLDVAGGGTGDGTGDGSGGGGGGTSDIRTHPNYAYVQKAHTYFENVKVQSNDPDVRTFKTYISTWPFDNAADVYDNGIAAIMYTVMGRATDAGDILNSYLQIYQGLEDWGNAQNPVQEKKLLTARVYQDTLEPNDQVDGNFEDLGNNSYMMLAFCKYYNQFLGDGATQAQLLPYYDRAYKILDYIWRTRKYTNGQDRFFAREKYRDQYHEDNNIREDWTSTEHNINLYAFGKCMQQNMPSGQGYSATLINDFTNVAGNFVAYMWDGNLGTYRVGTYPGTDAWNMDYTGSPVDTVTWRYLSGAGHISSAVDTTSINYMLSNHWVLENFVTLNGSNPVTVNNFYGVRFTDYTGAWGSQIENTGAALAALKKHGGYASSANQIESSLKALFDARPADQGLPSHQEDVSSSCCNTGLTWSYYDQPHTASTAYGVLGLIGQNPYQATKSDNIRIQPVIIP